MLDDLVIIGAGPSGLAAAHQAVRLGAKVSVLERLKVVGGLARTTKFQGSRFDIGPHRFFTKNQEVRELFVEALGEDLLAVPRLSRIFYEDKYFDYPLTPLNALFGVGVPASLSMLSSYAMARARRALGEPSIQNYEDWVVDRFGRRLFKTFFKSYTEKVWGIPCTQISAQWAEQRIKRLSLTTAVVNAFFKWNGNRVKSLVDEFLYPRLGAGQVYEKMAATLIRSGSRVVTDARVVSMCRQQMRIMAVEVEDAQGRRCSVEARQFLISAPLTEIIEMIKPEPPPEVLRASRALRYRNHIAVNLVVDGRSFPDNWIYVHSKKVAMARIANYANFSAAMAARPEVSPITIEYFCFPGDDLWNVPEYVLMEWAKRELLETRILEPDQILGGFITRSDKAYPVIEFGYEHRIAIIKGWLDQFKNLLPIGRSGMFKYNNQDHAMATGLTAARTALGIANCDPWMINNDAEYQESAPAFAGG
jgi:protoporphyrinogen oxidase